MIRVILEDDRCRAALRRRGEVLTLSTMPALLEELLRLRRNRSAQLGALVAAAVLYELFVLASGIGTIPIPVTAMIALSFVLVRDRAVLALVIGTAAILVITAVGVRSPDRVWTIGPYFGVLVPVLAGALDDRPRVRTFAAALAVCTASFATAWGYGFAVGAGGSGRPALAISAVLVCGAPLAAAAIWRRPPLRDRIVGFVRQRIPAVTTSPGRVSGAVWVAVAVYGFCVVLDLFFSGTFASVVIAAPLAAALIWWRSRPDVSLVSAATGLALTAVITPLAYQFGAGELIAVLSAVIPVFGALIGDAVRIRHVAYGLLGASVLISSLVAGSLSIGLVALVIGGVVAAAAWAWRQRNATGHLRVRLRESEKRGRAAERGVQAEQERIRIAREVHDVVAHSLAVVIAQADGARYAAEARPTSVGPALEAIAETARTALGEVRTMLHDLRSTGPDVATPGPDEIPALIGTVRALGVEVEQADFGVQRPMTEVAGLAMFRIVQEALTNALRHGDRGTPISVDFDWGEQVVVVVVTNGLPADPDRVTTSIGHGIAGMHERAGLVGGECTAGPGSNRTFRVRASLPVLPAPIEPAGVADAFEELLRAGAQSA